MKNNEAEIVIVRGRLYADGRELDEPSTGFHPGVFVVLDNQRVRSYSHTPEGKKAVRAIEAKMREDNPGLRTRGWFVVPKDSTSRRRSRK